MKDQTCPQQMPHVSLSSSREAIGLYKILLGRAVCFTQPTYSNANLFQKHLQRYTQK